MASRSMKGFADDDDDDDDDDFGKETSSSHKDDGKNKSFEHKPSTPRSKHSATEQRRRSRINDRFRILRDLIPHSDQKRDKASFLLEVIEHIQFLQEKVQKYELLYPGWSPECAKLMPWKNSHARGEPVVDALHAKDSPASTSFVLPGDGTLSGLPMVVPDIQNFSEAENFSSGLVTKSASMSFPVQYSVGTDGVPIPHQRLLPDSEKMLAPPHCAWPRSCGTDSGVSSDILTGQEDLFIDEGTISLSSMYSERLLTTFAQALQSSGVDLSQASISVQINLGRRATCTPISSTKDQDDPTSRNRLVGNSRVRSDGEESDVAHKRSKHATG